MLIFVRTLCVFFLFISSVSQAQEWLITSVQVLNIDDGQYSAPQDVLIKNRRIHAIG